MLDSKVNDGRGTALSSIRADSTCCERQSALVVAAFCDFIDLPTSHGFLLELISFLPPLRVHVPEYSEPGFYRALMIVFGPR
jgi:hypothetical protein